MTTTTRDDRAEVPRAAGFHIAGREWVECEWPGTDTTWAGMIETVAVIDIAVHNQAVTSPPAEQPR